MNERTCTTLRMGAMGWISRDWLDAHPSIDAQVRSDMRIVSKFAEEGDEPIHTIVEDECDVGLPFDYAMRIAKRNRIDTECDYNLAKGTPTLYELQPTPLNHVQGKFFSELVTACEDNITVLVKAPTGTGKTVAALNTCAEFASNALIIVPDRKLARQWAVEAKEHLGLVDNEIGFVMSGRKHRFDRKITIAVIHNLIDDSKLPTGIGMMFGTVVWDECQNLGAREFSKTMPLFHARRRIAMSATPERTDGCDVMVENYFGTVRVEAECKPQPCTCFEVRYTSERKPPEWMHAAKEGALLKWLSEDCERNALLSRIALRCYSVGRKIVVISQFIEHAEHLRDQFIADTGLREEKVGLYTGSYTAEGDDGNAKRKKTRKSELDRIKDECDYIFGTYQMLGVGLDIPRLNAGIEATPRAHNVQAIGRVRRPCPGAPPARWFSITDVDLPRFVGYSRSRLREFDEAGVINKQLSTNTIYE